MTYDGKRKTSGITPDIKKRIILDYGGIQQICKAISESDEWGDLDGRNNLICSSFPDIGPRIIAENIIINVNQLRNLVLSEKCRCSVRLIEDFIRSEQGVFEHLNKYPDVESIEENSQRIIINLKHEKRTIIDK